MVYVKKGDRTTDNEMKNEEASATLDRKAPKRKKVYQRVNETSIPQELQDHFKKLGYELKAIRWSIEGKEDYRYLSRREKEGYEFVTIAELPDWYVKSVRLLDTQSRNGLVTMGDLCLMKIDTDLRQSRRDYYEKVADNEIASVDVHVLEKKGLRNLGSKSRVIMREPTFAE